MKTLLAPFNTAISGTVSEEDHYDELLPEVEQYNEGDNNSNDNSNCDEDDKEEGNDYEDNSVDKLQELSQDKQLQIMESMADVCATVIKV